MSLWNEMQEIQWYIVREKNHSRNATDIQELTLSSMYVYGKNKKEDYKCWQWKITDDL